MNIIVGDWIRRTYDSSSYHDTKWHLVETIVSGLPTTKCGREFALHTNAKVGNRLQISATQVFTRAIGQPQNCQRCS